MDRKKAIKELEKTLVDATSDFIGAYNKLLRLIESLSDEE
jgi:hypothetical protein